MPSFKQLYWLPNRIEELVENPCDAGWWVYVRTLYPAASDAFSMLLVPQPDEMLEEYADPKKSRRGIRRRLQQKWRRWPRGGGGGNRGGGGGFPDPDDLAGKWMGGREKIQMRRISPLEYVGWGLFNTSERLFWYWLLIDAGVDFVYGWHSGIMKSVYCTAPHIAQGRWDLPLARYGLKTRAVEPETWIPKGVEGVELATAGGIYFPAPYKISGFYSHSFYNIGTNENVDVWAQCWVTSEDGEQPDQRKEAYLDPGESAHFTFNFSAPNAVDVGFDSRGHTYSYNIEEEGFVSFIGELA